jgi:hypothetical protein
MRSLILLCLVSSSVLAKPCREYEHVAEYLNTKKFIKASRDARITKHEAHVDLGDINQARALAFRFPAFEDLGFGKPGSSGWTTYEGRHPHSALNGKKIGWEIKNNKGHARVRLDWDPEKGAHYNIEITEKANGKHETHKLAVSFLCGDKKCTEQQVIKMVSKIQ